MSTNIGSCIWLVKSIATKMKIALSIMDYVGKRTGCQLPEEHSTLSDNDRFLSFNPFTSMKNNSFAYSTLGLAIKPHHPLAVWYIYLLKLLWINCDCHQRLVAGQPDPIMPYLSKNSLKEMVLQVSNIDWTNFKIPDRAHPTFDQVLT